MKTKKNKELRGGVCGYAAQATLQFDAEILEKWHFPDGNYLKCLSP